MREIRKEINITNASYRTLESGDAKNTDLFFDQEHIAFFSNSENVNFRLHKDNLEQAILFIASILPRKYDCSSVHEIRKYSTEFVTTSLAKLKGFFNGSSTKIVTWASRHDVPQKNGKIDQRFYFNNLFEHYTYTDANGNEVDDKFIIRDYLAGGYSTVVVRKEDNVDYYDFIIENSPISRPNDNSDTTNSDDTVETEPLFIPVQEIYYGVPGCGKSRTVQSKLDEWDIPEERTRRVVFSPDYCSADFLGQILPTDVNGSVRYEFKPGPFTEILRKAYHDQSHEYALVIEEINRGNAAAIFSEVFQLLDRLKAPKGQYCAGWSEYCVHNDILQSYVGFPDGEGIRLPPNLTLLATMNTSDQNVYTLDNAFQRRWDMRLVSNKLDENSDQYKSPIKGLDCSWGKFRDEVNKIIVSSSASTGLSSLEDKRLGGWFVEADDSGEIAKDTFAYKVLKYLWDDALKMDRPSLFKNGLERTLEDVIEDYKDNNLGPAIFIDSFIEALTAK